MYKFTSDNWTDEDSEAAKIRTTKMDNHALKKFAEAAEYMRRLTAGSRLQETG